MASYTSRHHCHLNPSTEFQAKEGEIRRIVQGAFDGVEVEVFWGAEPVADLTITRFDALSPENEQAWVRVVRALAGINVFVVESRKLFTSVERDELESGTGEAS
jgi:hypothetical protein